MASRDRYKVAVTCPNCGEKGVLNVSEDDHPYMRGPDRRVDGLKGKFIADSDGWEIRVGCKKCGEEFIEFKKKG